MHAPGVSPHLLAPTDSKQMLDNGKGTAMVDRTDTAGWIHDPTGSHQLRCHDGVAFTQHVSDGEVAVDAAPVGHPLSGSERAVDELAFADTSLPCSSQPGSSAPVTDVQPKSDGPVWASIGPAAPSGPG